MSLFLWSNRLATIALYYAKPFRTILIGFNDSQKYALRLAQSQEKRNWEENERMETSVCVM